MYSRIFGLLLIGFLMIGQFALAEDEYTGQVPPIEIGSTCSPEDTVTYHWITRQREQWDIKELYPVPVEIDNPEVWLDLSQYRNEFVEVLDSQTGVQAFATACHSIWNSYVQGNARLFIKVMRKATVTDKTVQCENETWTSTTISIEESIDESEDLIAGDFNGYDVTTTSVEDLTWILSSAIDVFNRQPGADMRPNHEYFEQSN